MTRSFANWASPVSKPTQMNRTAGAIALALEASLSGMLSSATKLLGPGLLLTVNANMSYPLPDNLEPDGTILLQRIWTSNPQHYPVTGCKSKSLTAWTRQLLLDARIFVGEGDEAIQAHFSDHLTIRSLGLHSVLNTPLCDTEGKCFATVNLLVPLSCWPDAALHQVPSMAQDTLTAVQTYCSWLRMNT